MKTVDRQFISVEIRDAMGNFGVDSGASDDYCKGLLVGIVCALMPKYSFVEALTVAICALRPTGVRTLTEDNVPDSWLAEAKAIRLNSLARENGNG